MVSRRDSKIFWYGMPYLDVKKSLMIISVTPEKAFDEKLIFIIILKNVLTRNRSEFYLPYIQNLQ